MTQNDTLYWWTINGQKRGPAPLDHVRDLVRNGTIPRTETLWSLGWDDWRSVESLRGALALPLHVRPASGCEQDDGVASHQARPSGWHRAARAAVIAAVLAAAVFAGLLALGRGDGAKITTAELAIERLLKAPATAKFLNVVVIKEGDGHLVTGDVDAQNSFGATLRSRWVVAIKEGRVTSAALIPPGD